ncbi:MAG TPA: hypothetical protein VH062_35880 [Polyangiaceae bacterium]|jgi:cytochrome c5|nr:hypothetical protein [Polyangiaceae bacterium]
MKVIFTFKSFRRALALLVAVAGGGVYGCAVTSAAVPVVAGDQQWASSRWPGTTMNDLSRGHDVFASRCSSCHSLPSPAAKTPDEWSGVLDEMANRAKLSTDDRELVNRYLSAASQRLRTQSSATRTGTNSPAL